MPDESIGLLYASPRDDAAWVKAIADIEKARGYRLADGQLLNFPTPQYTHLAILEPSASSAEAAAELGSQLGCHVTAWSFAPITDVIGPKSSARARRHLLPTLTNPLDGRIDALDDWYTNHHVPEVTQVAGFVAGRRYEAMGEPSSGAALKHRRLALYEIEGNDPEPALRRLEAALPVMVSTDVLDVPDIASWCFSPIEALQG